MNAQLALVVPSSRPRIFVHEGARQALERRFASAVPVPVLLSITDNRHAINSREGGVLRVRLHHMFLDAPLRVQAALVRYVVRGDPAASRFVGQYIEVNGARLARRSRAAALVARGERHDLLSILQDLNERYFDGAVNALAEERKFRHYERAIAWERRHLARLLRA